MSHTVARGYDAVMVMKKDPSYCIPFGVSPYSTMGIWLRYTRSGWQTHIPLIHSSFQFSQIVTSHSLISTDSWACTHSESTCIYDLLLYCSYISNRIVDLNPMTWVWIESHKYYNMILDLNLERWPSWHDIEWQMIYEMIFQHHAFQYKNIPSCFYYYSLTLGHRDIIWISKKITVMIFQHNVF